jgi:hypothetical protein
MSESTQEFLEGGCLCGDVRYRVRGHGRHQSYCHCRSCRLAAGASPVAWATFDDADFEVTQGALSMFTSSPVVHRGFCGRCGTSITYAHEGRVGELDVTIATLDDPSAIVPERHLWMSDRPAWPEPADGLERHDMWHLG